MFLKSIRAYAGHLIPAGEVDDRYIACLRRTDPVRAALGRLSRCGPHGGGRGLVLTRDAMEPSSMLETGPAADDWGGGMCV